MRITGGELCGRILHVPKTQIRPTQDRVREACFCILGGNVGESRFADLFAGSGSVGLEAWSRGAAQVCMVENNRRAFSVLQANVTNLCGEAAATGATIKTVCCEVLTFLGRQQAKSFDIVYMDPPYRSEVGVDGRGGGGSAEHRLRTVESVACRLRDRAILSDRGVLIVEQAAGEPVFLCDGWEVLDERRYGGTRLVFARAVGPE